MEDNSVLAEHASGWRNNSLYIGKTSKNLEGVFSAAEIKQNDIIEVCPLILFSNQDVEFLQYTNLYNYHSFKNNYCRPGFLPLGFGAIYNHSSPSNAKYEMNLIKKILTISAVIDIEPNAEITINYNGKFDDSTPVAFTSKNEVYEFSVTLF